MEINPFRLPLPIQPVIRGQQAGADSNLRKTFTESYCGRTLSAALRSDIRNYVEHLHSATPLSRHQRPST